MSSRFDRLEEELRSSHEVPMLREVFPETPHIQAANHSSSQTNTYANGKSTAADFQKQQLANVGCLLRVLTLMEDTVTVCALTTHWSHPLNRGWVNYFARWATAPTFRMWWPLLRPMYGPTVRTFLEDRFGILRGSEKGDGSVSHVDPAQAEEGFAYIWWRERARIPDLAGRELFQYTYRLPASDGNGSVDIQVALAAIIRQDNEALWTTDDFFVPLSLWGGGLGADFLRSLMDELKRRGAKKCVVAVLEPNEPAGNRAAWDERLGFLDFYRQAGFRAEAQEKYPHLPATRQRLQGSSAILSRRLG
jgi:hypothetical protein